MEEYSTRQQKVGRLIQKELGEYFRLNSLSVFGGRMISVTVVRVSKDLAIARCYLSVFPSDNVEAYVEEVNKIAKNIRYSLGQKIKKQVRIIPELSFHVDDSLDYAENIENLLNN
ncbi:30S ribosome-binding factor RbfA [Halosquirtibacter xylanolyticus]|uniref:30S ribosome-binding factor RbfA n=1 Tax=Halosquirtibacter xylanolyticus TaxID=3374599 RepID=UPI00374916EA|nr:30S ribosome-binding factor RbfA [Prolixibacteraceae bacterium]